MAAFVTPTPLMLATHQQSSLCSSLSTGSLRSAAGAARNMRVLRQAIPVAGHGKMEMNIDMDVELEEEPREETSMVEDTKLFVGNLSWGTTNASLEDAFSSYGTVVDARVIMDRYTGRSRGFGFIEYENASSAEEALLQMNGADVDGRNVRVDWANRRNRPSRQQNHYY